MYPLKEYLKTEKMQELLSNFELFKTIANENPNLVVDKKSLLLHSTSVEQIKYLLSTGKLDLTLQENQRVVSESSTEKILALIEAGFDMNLKDSETFNITFLYSSITPELVLPLLEKGLDINYTDKNDRSVLVHHCLNEQPPNELIECLIQNGADVNVSFNGSSVLYLMIQERKYNSADLLMKYSAKLFDNEKVKDKLNKFIHHASSHIEGYEVTKLLLETGADPNHLNNVDLKYTPLQSSASAEMTELLLKYGADPQFINAHGRTALHYAKNIEITQVLLDAGAKVNIIDTDSNYPFNYSSSNKQNDLLLDYFVKETDGKAKICYTKCYGHGWNFGYCNFKAADSIMSAGELESEYKKKCEEYNASKPTSSNPIVTNHKDSYESIIYIKKGVTLRLEFPEGHYNNEQKNYLFNEMVKLI